MDIFRNNAEEEINTSDNDDFQTSAGNLGCVAKSSETFPQIQSGPILNTERKKKTTKDLNEIGIYDANLILSTTSTRIFLPAVIFGELGLVLLKISPTSRRSAALNFTNIFNKRKYLYMEREHRRGV